jgi:LmbE family N-acetylglucosaminyl deacetylase
MEPNPYWQFAADFGRLVESARSLPLGTFAPAPRPEVSPSAPTALFFAPHPDDECISGGPAVRLLREAGMNVVNVAVTQGSNKDRQAGRLQELRKACEYLGFGVIQTAPSGLEKINPKTRNENSAHWLNCVGVIHRILAEHRPRVVIFPHEQDWNGTHIGTHHLVMGALRQMPSDFECFVVETEFWGQMDDPNLMLEMSTADVGDMVTATTFHIGEVARNPYHLLLPAWMMDNVRRGAELVGGQGGAAPDFTFAVLNRLRRYARGQLVRFYEGGKQVPRGTNIGTLFA